MSRKMVAPVIDRLLCAFDRVFLNPSVPTDAVKKAMDPVFTLIKPLMPMEKNDEAKQLWLRIPRGSIEDYGSFDDMQEHEEANSREEFEKRWKEDYPDEYNWYSLIAVEIYEKTGDLRHRAISFGNEQIINAIMNSNRSEEFHFSDEFAIELCHLIIPAIQEALCLLNEGTYNDLVSASLPYWFRTGVIKRSALYSYEPEMAEFDYKDIWPEILAQFRYYIVSGENNKN